MKLVPRARSRPTAQSELCRSGAVSPGGQRGGALPRLVSEPRHVRSPGRRGAHAGASVFGALDSRPRRHSTRDTVYALAALTGIAGLVFHAYNIGKRPGGLSWLNLFYAAPVGAPAALVLAGLLGKGAESVRHRPPRGRKTVYRFAQGAPSPHSVPPARQVRWRKRHCCTSGAHSTTPP